MSFETRIQQAAELIANANYFVVFSGAGLSTESGIPDFRGPDGVWTRRDKGLPAPKAKKPWNEIEPNEGHYAIVEFQKLGLLKFVISQNVDNLHLRSGLDPQILAEFHGNGSLMVCDSCLKKYQKEGFWDSRMWGEGYRRQKEIPGQPTCPDCGGRIYSSVVNFGDSIPRKELDDSYKHSQKADVFLVVGSSVLVTPASEMPKIAVKKGNAKLIIINKEATGVDNLADIRFYEGAGEVLTSLLREITKILKKTIIS